ncbi:hypothetical protein FOCC_FOCC011435 [Frankliniella occidentalis]|nr:hypothetical protein FOCC_FOCC011435 [Frankliniella occidentalis]
MLVHDGFLFFRECRTGNAGDRKHTWRCHEYHKMRCKGRCMTVDDVVVKISGEHNHAPDLGEIARREEEERLAENRSGTKISWKCMEYFRLRCRGRCQTVDFKVTKVTDMHCHPPVPEIIKKKMAERQNQQLTDT